MKFLKQIFKDAMIYMGIMFAILLGCLILAIPIIIGLALNSIPLVLFGILFFSAFGTAIAKYGIERQVKDD